MAPAYRSAERAKSTDRGKRRPISSVRLAERGISPIAKPPPLQTTGDARDRSVQFKRQIVWIDELEALALSELRKNPWCQGATRVFIAPRPKIHPVTGARWVPTRVHPGVSGAEACKREVWRVCERLGRHYELAGE